MDEQYQIIEYFPLGYSELRLSEYVKHHLEHFWGCSENDLFTSAYTHLHILYMTFVYIQIFRMSKIFEEIKQKEGEKNNEIMTEFEYFVNNYRTKSRNSDFKNKITTPFNFSTIRESDIFDFFYLLGFDFGSVRNLSLPIKKRNERLHAKGEIFFKNEDDFQKEFEEYIERMNQIIKKQKI